MTDIQHIRLSDLTAQIRRVIEDAFQSNYFWVVAEVSGHKYYPNADRHYFTLIEKQEGQQEPVARVDGAAWQAGAQAIAYFEKQTGQKFTSGLQVLVQVRVEFHASKGFKLIVLDIDSNYTLGNLERQRRETLEKLVTQNGEFIKRIGEEYFTRNKQQVVNRVIQRLAIIGSPKSEGYTDFRHTLENNQYGYTFRIDIYQSPVQGADAGAEMKRTLVQVFNSKIAYDCVVIVRGGGAATDFLLFDDYELARTVAKFPIPVITGIGHHINVSIVDLMAHTSTKTPTKAAEHIIFHNRSFEEELVMTHKQLLIRSQQLLAGGFRNVNDHYMKIINRSRSFISHHQQEVNDKRLQVINSSARLLSGHKDQLSDFRQVLVNKTKSILFQRRSQLVDLLNELLSRPRILTAHRQAELNNLGANLVSNARRFLAGQQSYLGHYVSVVRIMSPQNVLKKGFAIVSQKGKVLNTAKNVEPGNELTITMNEFELNTKVLTKTKINDGKTDL